MQLERMHKDCEKPAPMNPKKLLCYLIATGNRADMSPKFLPILCADCKSELTPETARYKCECGNLSYTVRDGVICADQLKLNREVSTRDSQAEGYLLHGKFPTQIKHFEKFISANPPTKASATSIDLGCGPGPTTALLSERGYSTCGVDFSLNSLLLNKSDCESKGYSPSFCQANLNNISFKPESASLLIMCDFLQHLGGRSQRQKLLLNALSALQNGGRFYLSCFNINLINYLKQDIHGAFADGSIEYERLGAKAILIDMPAWIQIDSISYMNIFNGVFLDGLATRLPGARLLARMVAITGTRVQ